MGLIIIILIVLIAGICEFIRYDLKRYKLARTMRPGQVWRRWIDKDPESPWRDPEYIDYLITGMKTNRKGDTWIQYKVYDTTPGGPALLGIGESYHNYTYELKAYKFIRWFEPVLIKNIE